MRPGEKKTHRKDKACHYCKKIRHFISPKHTDEVICSVCFNTSPKKQEVQI